MRDKRQSAQTNASDGADWSEGLRVTVGARVRKARSEGGLSQQALADAMTELGVSWRQTTVAKTEAADRPVLFTEVVALSRILSRDLDYFFTNRTALDDLKDELARNAEAARKHVRAAESMLQSAKSDEARAIVKEGIALAVTEYTYTGDSGILRRSVDVFTASPAFTLDDCMKVLTTAGVPRESVKAIDQIAMREAALLRLRGTYMAEVLTNCQWRRPGPPP